MTFISHTGNGRRFVVSDIHGCLKTFRHLLENRLQLTSADQLFLLGDYIDRGESNAGVLDYILRLKTENYQVYPLRGNHEEMILGAWQLHKNQMPPHIKFADRLWDAPDLLDATGELPDTYVAFFKSLPYFYELDNFYLVHAAIDFKHPRPFTDYSTMVWEKQFSYNPGPKIVVHGHKITPLPEIIKRVENRSLIIPLDNGCYYGLAKFRKGLFNFGRQKEVGNLCCLNLDTFELVVQENNE
ncbi:metallophosphoesterase family protein [Rhodocytophaga aerolata]|uniref:Metallophosphoesterase family protein n=1 Tax=Rhodocytophaga aerolata TaxID=455078 RepID=A0ABT8R1M3_9BACT|nr:metallophosphoesterase family protein [Rhodocytophaga aerolata]MDO1445819.1 metallophosphoesterase family protein [Rhodocytophaga aerolata]